MIKITLQEIREMTCGSINIILEEKCAVILHGMPISASTSLSELRINFDIESNYFVTQSGAVKTLTSDAETAEIQFITLEYNGIKFHSSLTFKNGLIRWIKITCSGIDYDLPIIINSVKSEMNPWTSHFQQEIYMKSYVALSLTDPRLDQSSSLTVSFPSEEEYLRSQKARKKTLWNWMKRFL